MGCYAFPVVKLARSLSWRAEKPATTLASNWQRLAPNLNINGTGEGSPGRQVMVDSLQISADVRLPAAAAAAAQQRGYLLALLTTPRWRPTSELGSRAELSSEGRALVCYLRFIDLQSRPPSSKAVPLSAERRICSRI